MLYITDILTHLTLNDTFLCFQGIMKGFLSNIAVPSKGNEHPSPGKPFWTKGFPRVCYLPDNTKGKKVIKFGHHAHNPRSIYECQLICNGSMWTTNKNSICRNNKASQSMFLSNAGMNGTWYWGILSQTESHHEVSSVSVPLSGASAPENSLG